MVKDIMMSPMCYYRETVTIKTCRFHCPFSLHPSYLHDFGALGSLAGARPAQHEHNLRLHPQRHSVKQARHLLTSTADPAADHKPALAQTRKPTDGGKKPERLVCQDRWAANTTTPLSTNGGLSGE